MSERTPEKGPVGGTPAGSTDSGLLLDGQSGGEPGGPTGTGDVVAHAMASGHGDDGSVDARQASLWSDAWRQLRRNKLFLIAAFLLLVLSVMAMFPGLFSSINPSDRGACQLSSSKLGPRSDAWFGNDIQGCDHYANVIYGARVSMIIGLVVVGGSTIIGIVLGALAGFFGGWFDTLMARITDIVFGLPLLLGAILILGVFPERGLPQVCLALIVLGWPTTLRLFRASVIAVKDTDYVAAARAMGATNGRIIVRHILPNAIAPVLVYATIAVGGIIAAEATLSFLGIGLQLPAVSWGLQIGSGQRLIRTAPHIIFFPSAFLSVTVLSFILLGDALRDALDPKTR
ncbi:MAG: peptide transporter permease [Frankiales bacterium]|nr:peptide transporter permease [Frankiales bacterium]